MSFTSEQIEQAISDLLDARAPDATICPSEVARKLAPDAWRPLMPQVRAVAVELAGKGELEILQKKRVVPLDSPLHGPIRLGRSGK